MSPNSCIVSYPEKHWSHSWRRLLPRRAVTFTRRAVSSCRNACLTVRTPFTKVIRTLTRPATSGEQPLRAIRGGVSWAMILTLPPIKLNARLSPGAFLFQSSPFLIRFPSADLMSFPLPGSHPGYTAFSPHGSLGSS